MLLLAESLAFAAAEILFMAQSNLALMQSCCLIDIISTVFCYALIVECSSHVAGSHCKSMDVSCLWVIFEELNLLNNIKIILFVYLLRFCDWKKCFHGIFNFWKGEFFAAYFVAIAINPVIQARLRASAWSPIQEGQQPFVLIEALDFYQGICGNSMFAYDIT